MTGQKPVSSQLSTGSSSTKYFVRAMLPCSSTTVALLIIPLVLPLRTGP
jgi:hypothetical protein